MSLTIKIAARREISHAELWDMHKLRARVFRERMGWDVSIIGSMEIDGYDAIDPHYMLIREHGILVGCFRLLSTAGPYMLKDTFSQLLHGSAPPEDPDIWEISRFAMENAGQQVFGFSDIGLRAIKEIIAYGHRAGIKQYVSVTTTAIERMLRRAGIVIKRLGPALTIGVENSVALYWDIKASVQALSLCDIQAPGMLDSRARRQAAFGEPLPYLHTA